MFLLGIGLLLYPTVSDYWNGLHQSRAIASYDAAVQELDTAQYDEMLAEARAYNETLLQNPARFTSTEAETAHYRELLDVSGTGIMAYVEIPKLGTRLPVYHGTDDAVLQIAVGHIEGSSLPVGGAGTHTVLSGHRGLPSAKLFTDLDQLENGDRFVLHVLGDALWYEVDQILTVLPEEMDALAIDAQEDYCTLVTCTPYGVNTHRLLVRGHRVAGGADGAENAFLNGGSQDAFSNGGAVGSGSEYGAQTGVFSGNQAAAGGAALVMAKLRGAAEQFFRIVPLPVASALIAFLVLIFLLCSGRSSRRKENAKQREHGDRE